MADLLYNCDDDIIDPVCDPCLEDLEQGGIRSIAFIHNSIYADIMEDPEDPNKWAQGIEDKLIYIIPETKGSFDGGAPVEVPGYGHVATRVVGFNFGLNYKDPTLKGNCGFYNTIKKSSKYHIAFATESQVRLSGKPVSITPKAPVGEDLNSETVWDNDVKWTEKNQPCMFDTPDGIFTCTPIEPVPVVPFEFKFGFGEEAPADENEIILGTDGTGNHNGKAVVPDFGNTEDAIVWYAEPTTEPIKTVWFNTTTNTGGIGSTELFLAPVIMGTFRVYVSAYATSFDSPKAVEFRIV